MNSESFEIPQCDDGRVLQAPFAFTGTVKKALLDVSRDQIEDMAAKMKMCHARQ